MALRLAEYRNQAYAQVIKRGRCAGIKGFAGHPVGVVRH